MAVYTFIKCMPLFLQISWHWQRLQVWLKFDTASWSPEMVDRRYTDNLGSDWIFIYLCKIEDREFPACDPCMLEGRAPTTAKHV